MESKQEASLQDTPIESKRSRPFFRRVAGFLSRAAVRVPVPFWMVYDALMAVASVWIAYQLSPSAVPVVKRGIERTFHMTTGEWLTFGVAAIVGGMATGVYEKQALRNTRHVFSAHLQRALFASAALAIAWRVIVFGQTGRYIILLSGVIYFIASFFPRSVIQMLLQKFPIRVLLVGDPDSSSSIFQRLQSKNHKNFTFVGFCAEGKRVRKSFRGPIESIPQVCREKRVDEIVIGKVYATHPGVLQTCFETVQHGCYLTDECSFCEEVFEQIPVDHIDDSWFLTSKIQMSRRFGLLLKKAVDFTFSVFGLIVLSPAFPILYLLVRLTSNGPAFYTQERYGQYGRVFNIYKFRTMVVDAESGGQKWAQKNDPRVTPIGGFLRVTRLDEIPQLWNVLRGDMSFVGPRPERPGLSKQIEKEVPYFFLRLWARPGLTGLAQTRYRYGASVDDAREKLQYDLYYIKNWSVFLDIQIFFRTFLTLMKGSR